jgi:hypothetical protein
MIISYIDPLNCRDEEVFYIHYFYKQIQDIGYKNIFFLTSDSYFNSVEHWKV